jgi:RHS repeat-associated protein
VTNPSTRFSDSAINLPPTQTRVTNSFLPIAVRCLLLLAALFFGTSPAHATWVAASTSYPTAAAFCAANYASLPGSGLPGNKYQNLGATFIQSGAAAEVTCNAIVFFPPSYTSSADLSASAFASCTSPLVFDMNAPSGCSPANDVQPGKQIGADCNCHTGDVKQAEPIDINSGNGSYKFVDYETAGQNKLSFMRYYNSRSGFIGTLASWRSNYDRYVLPASSGTSLIIQRPDGQSLSFTKSGSAWVSDTDVDYTVSSPDGVHWTVTTPDDAVETYTVTTVVASSPAYLTSITSQNGYTQTLGYDPYQELLTVTDSYSRVLTFGYNSDRQLTSVSTPDASVVTLGYTTTSVGTLLTSVSYNTSPATGVTYRYGESSAPSTALTSVPDENGSVYQQWTYDAYGRGLTSFSGGALNAALTTVTYNDTTGSRTVTNALGVTDTYSFATLQGVPKVSGISRAATATTAAATESFGYDTNGYLNSATDWNGNQTTYANNSHGAPTTINEAVGSTVARTPTIVYDSTFVHLPHSITTPGVTASFAYDTSGETLTKILTDTTSTSIPYSTNGQARTWTYTYSNHLLATAQTPRTDVTATTTLGYGTDGALTSITDALGHVTSITAHAGGGLPTTIVDPNSISTTLTYDARQRLTTSAVNTMGGALTTTFTVDPTGEITKVNPPDNRYRQFTYDAAHRATKITDGYLQYIQHTLNALGSATQAQTFDSSSTLWHQHNATYDALGRALTDVGGAGQTKTFTYDKNGNALTVADGLSQTTTRVFDALNRLNKSTDATSGVAQWTFDAHDRVLTAQDQGTHTTSFVYDGFGDVIQETSPDRGTTVYHYDNNGNLTSKTDALGVVANRTFDNLDRVLTTTYPADSTLNIAYTYDQTNPGVSWGVGRLTTVTDQAGTLTHEYDERGNMIHEDRTTGGVWYATSYSYDVGGHIVNISYPDGSQVGYQYDIPGTVYIVSAQPAGAGTATTIAPNVAHLPFGPINNFQYGNGSNEHWYTDLDYRFTSISANTSGGSGPAVMHLDYTYDAANNVKTITDYVNAVNSQTLGYDVLNRLHTAVSGTGGYGSYTYNFDGVGNLSSLVIGSTTTNNTYTIGTNRLSAIGTTAVATNANGNITSAPIVGGTTAATYTYSKANRISTVSGGGSTAVTGITYDAFGRRITKAHASGSPVIYFYDQDGNVIAENNGGTFTDYVYVDGIPFAILRPTASPAASQINYVSTDLLGTPQFIADSSGTAVWGNTYKPFGQGGTPTGSITNNVRLPGQAYDSETGFHYNLNRDYMPNLGRYLEADPIGLVGGLNPYRYARANPFKYTDQTGLSALTVLIDETQKEAVRQEQSLIDQSLQKGHVSEPARQGIIAACMDLQSSGVTMAENDSWLGLMAQAAFVGAKKVAESQAAQDFATSQQTTDEEQAAKGWLETTSHNSSTRIQQWMQNSFPGYNSLLNSLR